MISKELQWSHNCNTQPYLLALWTEYNVFDKEPFFEASPDVLGVPYPKPTEGKGGWVDDLLGLGCTMYGKIRMKNTFIALHLKNVEVHICDRWIIRGKGRRNDRLAGTGPGQSKKRVVKMVVTVSRLQII